MAHKNRPKRDHPHVAFPLKGRVNSAPNGTFMARCKQCGAWDQGDYGVMGEEYIRDILKHAGWTAKGKGKDERFYCDECSVRLKHAA